MLVVLLQKRDYNTRVAVIDTKISSLDGKITENKNNLKKSAKCTVLLFLEIQCLMREMVFKPI